MAKKYKGARRRTASDSRSYCPGLNICRVPSATGTAHRKGFRKRDDPPFPIDHRKVVGEVYGASLDKRFDKGRFPRERSAGQNDRMPFDRHRAGMYEHMFRRHFRYTVSDHRLEQPVKTSVFKRVPSACMFVKDLDLSIIFGRNAKDLFTILDLSEVDKRAEY
ncbi:MAG: hypothetical protein IPM63_03170 [Acidobacteriota bacterium]|nr:MAG: hypothetical protein IPM63_03170 [Acidobacteriota bacterium]